MSKNEFIAGFAEATGFDMQQADEQWAGFSRNLSDAEIEREEAGGREAGVRNGELFLAMFRA